MKTLFFAFVLFIAGCGNSSGPITTLEPGDTAPGFKLKNIDGEMVSLEDYPNAKGFILVFTANTCPYAIAYEERLIALGEKYNALGYPVIAINANAPGTFSGDSFEQMQKKSQNQRL